MHAGYVLRELTEASDAAEFCRLRHRVFCEELKFWRPSSSGIQVEGHDHRARFFGLFHGPDIIGGFRIVFRAADQRLAPVIRGMRAVIPDAEPEVLAPSLPAEDAFCLAAELGPLHKLVDLEVGRLFVRRPGSCPGLLRKLLVAGTGIIILCGARRYAFTATVQRFANFATTRPCRRLTTTHRQGVYPGETHAFIACPEESEHFEEALQLADEFSATGSIHLLPEPSP